VESHKLVAAKITCYHDTKHNVV